MTEVVKPPCPHCSKREFVYWDTKNLKWFCWRNFAKEKMGCGWTWAPGHEQDEPVAGVTRTQAPAAVATIPPVMVGRRVFCSGGREIPLENGWTYTWDNHRSLHLVDAQGTERYVIADGIWLLIQVD